MKYLVIFGVGLLMFAIDSDASARPFARGCTPGFDADLRDVIDYIDVNMDAVRTEFEKDHFYHSRRGASRRVKRRLRRDRKLGNIWFACAKNSAPLCKNSSGRHAMGAASNKIRLCEQNVRARSTGSGVGFCNLTELVAHEFGHAVGIKKDKVGLHSKNQSDRVYQWGFTWGKFCRAAGDDRDLRPAGGRPR